MAIAMDVEHAKGIAGLLKRRLGVPSVVVTSDDPEASKLIAEFGKSKAPWLVAVRMVSEGVDIQIIEIVKHGLVSPSLIQISSIRM